MITVSDIEKILYKDCATFGVEVFPYGNVPEGEITAERIVVHSKPLQTEKIWNKSFCDVNICVPDKNGQADKIRIDELAREAQDRFKGIVGDFDGTPYHYTWDTIGVENDTQMRCHYVNVRILFEVLNID